VKGEFVHVVNPPVLKWVARVRSGGLATHARLTRTHLLSSPQCWCCAASEEDDAHAIAGCPGTGAAACGDEARLLWLHCAQRRGVVATPLPASWVADHLLQVAAALIPSDIRRFLPSTANADLVLNDFHKGMAERLAEVMRRREVVRDSHPSQARPQAPNNSSIFPVTDPVRQLTLAELRAAEARLLPPPPFLEERPRSLSVKQCTARQLQVTMGLSLWIQAHRFLRVLPKGEVGTTSVALLLLWETNHADRFPCNAAGLSGRVQLFTKRLSEAVAADADLRGRVEYKKAFTSLCPGLRHRHLTVWNLQIENAVGDPFNAAWKAHLAFLASAQHFPVPVDAAAIASPASSLPAPTTSPPASALAPPAARQTSSTTQRLGPNPKQPPQPTGFPPRVTQWPTQRLVRPRLLQRMMRPQLLRRLPLLRPLRRRTLLLRPRLLLLRPPRLRLLRRQPLRRFLRRRLPRRLPEPHGQQ